MRVHIVGCMACKFNNGCEYKENIKKEARNTFIGKHMTFRCDGLVPLYKAGDKLLWKYSYKAYGDWNIRETDGVVMSFNKKYLSYRIRSGNGVFWCRPSRIIEKIG